ncbi:hypothetical protein BKA70DRAFT_1437144 [Coprinopsis sp. MPI-PUGE-AT-0042]|nr:hypothetical protein BKA70DRAFT_1437144 [Coprinopsis sp. MPI-PUGE-AT-0042]
MARRNSGTNGFDRAFDDVCICMPKGFDLTTTFVKTATSTILILILIVACKEKEANSGATGATGKQVHLQELPLAAEDLLLSPSSSPCSQTAITSALHASPPSSIVFACGKSIVNHLKTLATQLTTLAEPQDPGAQSRLVGLLQRQLPHLQTLDVKSSYLTLDTLWRHKNHIEGFSPEVARIIGAGQFDLKGSIAIRLTSEKVMHPYHAKRNRDLPCSPNGSAVCREFKNPQPFLRPREFLWQEGRTTVSSEDEADTEVREILDLYRQVYETSSPSPPSLVSYQKTLVVCTRPPLKASSPPLAVASKPPLTASAKTIQIGNNSWGLSTRAIGMMVMVHGDNQGLALPRCVAGEQAVVVPCGITASTSDEQRTNINNACEELAQTLGKAGLRAKADLRDGSTPGYKFNNWEQKGVLLRLEIGPSDLAKKQTLTVRRDTGANHPVPLYYIGSSISSILETVQVNMFANVKKIMKDKMDNDRSYGGEEEPVRLSNSETDDQPAFHSVHTGYPKSYSQKDPNCPNEREGGVSLWAKWGVPILPSLRILLQETSYLQHRLQDDLLDPAEFDLPGTPPTVT